MTAVVRHKLTGSRVLASCLTLLMSMLPYIPPSSLHRTHTVARMYRRATFTDAGKVLLGQRRLAASLSRERATLGASGDMRQHTISVFMEMMIR